MITIVDYTEGRAEDFARLNLEWLERFFHVEEEDRLLLSDPQRQIILPGGRIFFAEQDGGVVGTVALLAHGAETMEVGKMAVTASAQGLGIGGLLLEHCISEARRQGVRSLFLYSNTSLAAAIHLYRTHGFTEVPLGANPYRRTNIKMMLVLSPAG